MVNCWRALKCINSRSAEELVETMILFICKLQLGGLAISIVFWSIAICLVFQASNDLVIVKLFIYLSSTYFQVLLLIASGLI